MWGLYPGDYPRHLYYLILDISPTKPSILSRVSPGHLYYLFLDISPTYFPNILYIKQKSRKSKLWKSENPKNQVH